MCKDNETLSSAGAGGQTLGNHRDEGGRPRVTRGVEPSSRRSTKGSNPKVACAHPVEKPREKKTEGASVGD